MRPFVMSTKPIKTQQQHVESTFVELRGGVVEYSRNEEHLPGMNLQEHTTLQTQPTAAIG